jgi:hypothetical protein
MIYKCEYCESEYEGNNCPYCGAPHPVTPTKNTQAENSNTTETSTIHTKVYTIDTTSDDPPEKITSQPWFVTLLIIFFFPVGLYLMWKNKVYNRLTRIIIALTFVTFVYAVSNDMATNTTTDTASSDTGKAVEVTTTNTPAPTPISTPAPTATPTATPTPTTKPKATAKPKVTATPTPTKKPLSKKEKFVKKVTSISGVSKKTAGNLYNILYNKISFKKVTYVQKSDTGKKSHIFNADDNSITVTFKKDGSFTIKWGMYTLYDGKEVIMNQKEILERELIDSDKYYTYAKEIILDYIKTPKTAEFPDLSSSTVSMQRKGKYVGVKSYFDAQNTYGVLVRSKYTIEFSVKDLKANIYKPVYINIDDEIRGKWVDLN